MLNKEKLIGKWRSLDIAKYGNIELHFDNQNNFEYKIIEDKNTQIIKLTYKIDGDYIVTDQPSSSKEEKTKANIINNILELEFNGVSSKYEKVV